MISYFLKTDYSLKILKKIEKIKLSDFLKTGNNRITIYLKWSSEHSATKEIIVWGDSSVGGDAACCAVEDLS